MSVHSRRLFNFVSNLFQETFEIVKLGKGETQNSVLGQISNIPFEMTIPLSSKGNPGKAGGPCLLLTYGQWLPDKPTSAS